MQGTFSAVIGLFGNPKLTDNIHCGDPEIVVTAR